MNLRRKIAALLAFVMAFSSVAVFSVAADSPAPRNAFAPLSDAIFASANAVRDHINSLTITGAAGHAGFANQGALDAWVLALPRTATPDTPAVAGFANQGALDAFITGLARVEVSGLWVPVEVTSATAGLPSGMTSGQIAVLNGLIAGANPRWASDVAVGAPDLGTLPTITTGITTVALVPGVGFQTNAVVAATTGMPANMTATQVSLINTLVQAIVWDAATGDALEAGGTWSTLGAQPTLIVAAGSFVVPTTLPSEVTLNGGQTALYGAFIAYVEGILNANPALVTGSGATMRANITTDHVNGFVVLAADAANIFFTGQRVVGAITNPDFDNNRPWRTNNTLRVENPITNVERSWVLVDRALTTALGGSIDTTGTSINRTAPELVIPIGHLNANGGTIEVALTGWANGTWGGFLNRVPAGARAQDLNNWESNSINTGDLPTATDSGFFAGSGSATYSGFAVDPVNPFGLQNELPFLVTFHNTVARIHYPAHGNMPANTVLRFPIAAINANGTFDHQEPTFSITAGVTGTPRELPILIGTAGVTASLTAVTSRDVLRLNRLTITEPINNRGAIRDNGQIVLSLPFGYVWDHNATGTGITGVAGSLAQGATFAVPQLDEVGIPRDGMMSQSVLVIDLPSTLHRPIGGAVTGSVQIDGLRIRPAGFGLQNILFGEVRIDIETGAGTAWTRSGSTANENGDVRSAFSSVTPSTILAGTFADFEVIVDSANGFFGGNTAVGGTGNVSTIVAGWLAGEERQTGRNNANWTATQAADRGNVSTVTVREVVANSGWFAHGMTFSLTDAQGNILDSAKIESVNFQTFANPHDTFANRTSTANVDSGVYGTFHNSIGTSNVNNWSNTHAHASGANGENAVLRGNARVWFSEDGHSVSVANIRLTDAAALRADTISVQAAFTITTDVAFEGEVYITVEGNILGSAVIVGGLTNPIQHVANVRSGITVETSVTTVDVGFQQIDIANITISETEIGDFRTGRNIQVGIREFGLASTAAAEAPITFVPIGAAAINRGDHMTITGDATPARRAQVALLPFNNLTTDTLTLNITRATQANATEPTTIELHNLQIRTVRNVPFGTYELAVFGNSVLNNADYTDVPAQWGSGAMFNMTAAGPQPGNRPLLSNEQGFRRYGFGPMILDYLQVITPGSGTPERAADSASVSWDIGGTFTVDGEVKSFANEAGASLTSINFPPGHLFVPLRAIIEGLGGEILAAGGSLAEGTFRIVTHLPGARFETVTWTVGESTVLANFNGQTIEVSLTNAPIIALEGNVPAGTPAANFGSTFLPLRGIAEAHGLEINPGTEANRTATISFR
ncbi:MAG: copper amine oxidase N-terminal domain-containing protein [Defluviitaleaceae bacterium]|nr:copper amine oxidase N-terminal domain-containing protein [Defluviitaleaceae bacterium]